MSVNQNNCNHDWEILTPDKGNYPGVSKCKKCGLWLYHSNRLQLEMNKYVAGFQKGIVVITIIISILALLISVTVAIFK